MRLCVSCVYWTLLLVSVVSSGLLFLIVASEGTQISEKSRVIDQEDNKRSEDVGDASSGARSESLDNKVSDVRARPTVKTEKEYLFPASDGGGPSGRETSSGREFKIVNNLNVIKQSLTPQPNLSQGISETGQAVVLNLVDTAAAELQSLAEPRLSSDIRSRLIPKNITLRTTTTGPIPATTTTTTASTTASSFLEREQPTEQTEKSSSSHSPIVPLTTESSSNLTKILSTEDETATSVSEATSQDVVEKKDEVVIVRAEQKIIDDTTTRKPEEIQENEVVKDESVKQEENLTASTELDDGAARAKLVGGSSEESAAVILDGLVGSGPTDHHHEDIPSFSEWAQKRLEEAEKKKTHPNASIQNPGGPGRGLGGMKMRSKNYASPDCGAKIVAVNPEARSARSVLVSTRDEYMLNTCTSRIWFVVELCEAIQAKKIELANFELFSSSPKDIIVHVSDRFPTRDWSPVGQFTAKDQRDIQSFPLNPQLFGKFIKVELHSHYGSEHFCPISLFRAYGTSEFEVLETETDHQEDDDDDDDGSSEDDEDEALDSENGGETRNLFGSARDAVLRIVKKAAEVLVKTGDLSNRNNITKIQESIEDSIMGNSLASCMTPRYTINCANCTDDRFAGVFELLNCRSEHLDDILRIPIVNRTLRSGEICYSYGFYMANLTRDTDLPEKTINDNAAAVFIDESSTTKYHLGGNSIVGFLASIYSPEYIIALCNVIATNERRLLLNTSYEFIGNQSVNSSTRIDADAGKFETSEMNGQSRIVTSSCLLENDSRDCKNNIKVGETIRDLRPAEREPSTLNSDETTTASTESLASQIKPTRALNREDMRKESSVPILEPSKDPNEERIQAEVLTTASPIINIATATTRVIEEPAVSQNPVESTIPIVTPIVTVTNSPNHESQELNGVHDNGHESGTPVRPDNNEPETRPVKPDNGEQEARLMANDQMSLDSIFSDLKDLEADATGIQANQNANIVAQPTASSTPQQKESVFLRLSNRIKALERNMSLSGQYLEELSKRYKKQVEEMQRTLERATAAMSEESRKGEERETRRIEEISILRDEITSLTRSMEILLYDRNSWRSKLSTVCQHFALVVVEIIVFILVVTYCRRNGEFIDIDESEVSINNADATRRRRSAGTMSSSGMTRKSTKKRRPSEIASARIGGTYRDLMIDERINQETRKDRKKRRKRETNNKTINNGYEMMKDNVATTCHEDDASFDGELSSRRSSSIDPAFLCHAKQLELRQKRKRPDSAPEYSGTWTDKPIAETFASEINENDFDETTMPIAYDERLSIVEMSKKDLSPDRRISHDGAKEKNHGLSLMFRGDGGGGGGGGGGIGISKGAKLSSPFFMKTALGARSKRRERTSEKLAENFVQLRSDNWEWYSRNSSNRSDSGSPTNLRIDVADFIGDRQDGARGTKNGRYGNTGNESESGSSTTTTSAKKEKKTVGGLRKMVRKFF